jgi:transposase
LSYAKVSPKRIQLPDDFYKHDFKQLAKIEKHPRTRIRFIGLSHIQNGKSYKSLSELDDVHNIINWSEIEQTLSNLYSSKTGASAYPPIMMFKILILQAWYALSDEALEKQIARDLMFRRLLTCIL